MKVTVVLTIEGKIKEILFYAGHLIPITSFTSESNMSHLLVMMEQAQKD
jgi:hypothetical protein